MPSKRDIERRLDEMDAERREHPQAGLITVVSTITNDGEFVWVDYAERLARIDGEVHRVRDELVERLAAVHRTAATRPEWAVGACEPAAHSFSRGDTFAERREFGDAHAIGMSTCDRCGFRRAVLSGALGQELPPLRGTPER
jgi:hypothetical protein